MRDTCCEAIEYKNYNLKFLQQQMIEAAPVIIFFAVSMFMFIWALGNRELWTTEARWAEVVREMFLTGDFFHPTINGEPYFDKPLFGYWLIALTSIITGNLNEWAVRIPSAFFGLISLYATIFIGSRLWSKDVGKAAGWILLTTHGVFFWARTGQADIENLAAIIICLAWYVARRNKLNFITFFVFYLIAFLGAQTKGLTAVVVPILFMIPDMLRERRWKILFSLNHLIALCGGLAFYFAPFIYSAMTAEQGHQLNGIALLFRENIQRYFQPFDHIEPYYVYFYYLPLFFCHGALCLSLGF